MTGGPSAPSIGWAEGDALRIPDGITPIVAYRMWLVDHRGSIMSPNQQLTRWSVGAWVTASCRRFGEHLEIDPPGHRAPAEGCRCGIYALKHPADCVTLLRVFGFGRYRVSPFDPTFATGVVELAGKVIEHELGYRAERARIVSIVPVQWRPPAPMRMELASRSAQPAHSSVQATRAPATTGPVVPPPRGFKRFPGWIRRNKEAIPWLVLMTIVARFLYWVGQWRRRY
jgi:hypothetical protein